MSVVEIIIVVCVIGSLICNYLLERNLTHRIDKLERQVSIGAHCEDTVLNTEDTIEYLKRIGIDYDGDTTKQKTDEASLNAIESVRNPAKLYDAASTVQKHGVDEDGDASRIGTEDLISKIRCATEELAVEILKEAGYTEHNVSLVGSTFPMYYSKRIWSNGNTRITIDVRNGKVLRTTAFE